MNTNLQLVKSTKFNDVTFDCYKDTNSIDASDFWATREQIGQLLDYIDPMRAIAHIHERNNERLDKFSTVVKLSTVEGSRTVTREMTVYNFKGLLEICRYSNQPKADAVMDFLWEIADEIRRTGSYNAHKTSNADELNYKKAELLQRVLEFNAYPMTDNTKAVFTHEIYRLVTGHENLDMLPQATEARYSATQIGEMFGVSANKIGRIAKDFSLKSKQGEANEFGTWICTKSRTSNHECLSFVYNDKAVAWFKRHFNR